MTYVFGTFLRRKLQALDTLEQVTLKSLIRSSLTPPKYTKRVGHSVKIINLLEQLRFPLRKPRFDYLIIRILVKVLHGGVL